MDKEKKRKYTVFSESCKRLALCIRGHLHVIMPMDVQYMYMYFSLQVQLRVIADSIKSELSLKHACTCIHTCTCMSFSGVKIRKNQFHPYMCTCRVEAASLMQMYSIYFLGQRVMDMHMFLF